MIGFLMLPCQGTEPLAVRHASAVTMKVTGRTVWRWREAESDLYLLEGQCAVEVDAMQIHSQRLLLQVQRNRESFDVQVLSEGAVRVDGQRREFWRGDFILEKRPGINASDYRGAPPRRPDLADRLSRGDEPEHSQRSPNSPLSMLQLPPSMVVNASFEQALSPASAPIAQAQSVDSGAASLADDNRLRFLVGQGAQAVEVLPRNVSQPPQISIRQQLGVGGTPSESVVVARGGVSVVVRDAELELRDQMFELGAVSLSADQIVGWMPNLSSMLSGENSAGSGDGEIYLEGDVVFRQGDRIIYADRMYYNVARQYGMVLKAEVLTTIPEYEGVVRLKAEVLQQVAQGEFVAFDAAVTTSRMGVPRYWLQSQQLSLSTRNDLAVDPASGLGVVQRRNQVSGRNNFVYAAGLPVFYWPVFSTDLQKSNYYVSGIAVKSDRIFGNQVFLDFDLFQLLGVQRPPPGVDWNLSVDYLSNRGPALGTNLDYTVSSLFGIAGPVQGRMDVWGIYDQGLDSLGVGRRDLPPERQYRGRAFLQHRHYMPNDWEFIAEVGFLSDRNFLEQYMEQEWDSQKDQDTAIRLRKYAGSHLLDVHAQVRVNDFFTETNQLPRLDHHGLGLSIFHDHLTWSMRNQVGYSQLKTASVPLSPVEAAVFTPLPGEVEARGVIAASRQEVAAPVLAGPVKVVPYLSGEVAHFGQDVNGDDRTRLLGQAGVRATLPMWQQFPTVQSNLLNIRSLAHKMEWRGEFFYADSTMNMDEIPLYESLEDNAQEQFRRRLIFDNFGGPPLPLQYDPRNYAFRQGIQRYVTSPSMPVADDLMLGRVGLTQRWQTKRGLPGRERIADLALLDFDVLLFPKDERDNFGETLGPARYDFRYHVGDRVTLLSDGYFDFFSGGLRSFSAGVMTSRPGLGDVYVGFLSIEGPISSSVLRTAIDYRLNEKWIMHGGATFDLGDAGSIGQSLGILRIGESGIWRLGLNVDRGRDNVGIAFGFEPRFLPKRRLGVLGGQQIPPPGLEGLE